MNQELPNVPTPVEDRLESSAQIPSPSGSTSVLRGLSGKLLILTILFVLFAEIVIFVPSVANFRNVWLQGKLDTAEAASIVFLDDADIMLSETAQQYLLDATQSVAVVVREGSQSTMMASNEMPGTLVEHINLDQSGPIDAIGSAFRFLFSPGDRYFRVFGTMKSRDAVIELVNRDEYLVAALRQYSINVLLVSLVISLITAALVFLALYRSIVRPVQMISQNMVEFSKTPEDENLVYRPTGRTDEIGVAEKRLAALQKDLQRTLRQKQNLADLGLAVSKINHDLRNILASASLFSDRLSTLPDPTVQKFAPRMIKAIDRAVEYTRSVIDFGRAVETPPRKRALYLRTITSEVGELLGLDQEQGIRFDNRVSADFILHADPEQMFRVIMNISRNAVQAMRQEDGAERGELKIDAARAGGKIEIRIADTGQGISEEARQNLFRAFRGSTKSGGTGLGMTISAELMRAHGGSIEVEETRPGHTVILLTLPDIGLVKTGM